MLIAICQFDAVDPALMGSLLLPSMPTCLFKVPCMTYCHVSWAQVFPHAVQLSQLCQIDTAVPGLHSRYTHQRYGLFMSKHSGDSSACCADVGQHMPGCWWLASITWHKTARRRRFLLAAGDGCLACSPDCLSMASAVVLAALNL